MRNYRSMLSAFILTILIGFSPLAFAKPKTFPNVIASKSAVVQPTECAAYLVADAKSGEIIESQSIDQPRAPASMTKLMTAYVVLKKVKEGSLNLDDKITTSAEASRIGGSQVYLKEGEVFTVKELLDALMIQSANDAALAFAQHISGSREGFVEEMNQTAHDLGMTNADFQSPHGLPPAADQTADLVSAKDFLILARALLKDFPQILEITKKEVQPFRDGTFEMRNHNGLLRTFEGTDGLKTGYYSQAGFCVTATAERKGVRLIAVLMGCPSVKIRNAKAASLMSKAFSQYKSVTLVKAGETVANVKVDKALKQEVSLFAENQVAVTSKVGSEQDVERKVIPCENLTAPIAKGLKCGTLQFVRGSEVVGSTPLLVSEDIAEAGLMQRLKAKIGW